VERFLPGFPTGKTLPFFWKIRLRRKDRIPFKPNVRAFLVGRPIDIRLDQAV
jgi:hypothetical protein